MSSKADREERQVFLRWQPSMSISRIHGCIIETSLQYGFTCHKNSSPLELPSFVEIPCQASNDHLIRLRFVCDIRDRLPI